MKKITFNLLFILCFGSSVVWGQVTEYTFTGTGNWTSSNNWSPMYPGLLVGGELIVFIDGTNPAVPTNLTIDTDLFFTDQSRLIVDNNASVINNGGLLFRNNPTTSAAGVAISGSFTNNASINIATDGDFRALSTTSPIVNNSTIRATSNASATFSGFINNDLMDLQPTGSGGIVLFTGNNSIHTNNGTIILSGTFVLNNNVNIANGPSAVIEYTNTFSDSAFNGTITNSGSVINKSIIPLYSGTIINENGATFTNDTAADVTFFGTLINNNGSTFTNSGIYNNQGTFTNSGTVINNGSFTSTSTITNTGTFMGTNTSHTNTFINDGILSPGNSVGIYTFNDDYQSTSNSSIDMELESASSFDQVIVGGNAVLDGTLNVSFLNGYTPVVGDSFDILTANTVTGTFSTINLPAGYTWDLQYDATTVRLVVSSVLDVNDVSLENIVTLYPNPTTDLINIKGLTEPTNYRIVNLLGAVVLEGEVSNNDQIDVSSIKTGIYLLQLDNKETRKIIKN